MKTKTNLIFAVRIWWSFFWRASLVGGIVGFIAGGIAGGVVGFIGHGEWGAIAGGIAGFIFSIPVGIWSMSEVIRVHKLRSTSEL